MEQALVGYHGFLAVMRVALFWLAAVAAVLALLDWLVRTRRVNPFGPVGRFCRRLIDPLMAPLERRIVRRGGMPHHAPWWALGIIIVGGILLITLLDFLGRVAADVAFSMGSPGRFGVMLVGWAFAVLRLALIVRVISSWFQLSPYSVWIRWSFLLTEWMLAPLRRVIPTFGAVDITPLVAFLLLGIIQSVLL